MTAGAPTIQHIPHECCPACGAGIAMVQIFHLHSNGRWNETMEFRCGARYKFDPNELEVTVTSACTTAMFIAEQRSACHCPTCELNRAPARNDMSKETP